MNRVILTNLVILLTAVKYMGSLIYNIRDIIIKTDILGLEIVKVDISYFRVLFITSQEQYDIPNGVMYCILFCIFYNILELTVTLLKKIRQNADLSQ